jgi:hypothetical protein
LSSRSGDNGLDMVYSKYSAVFRPPVNFAQLLALYIQEERRPFDLEQP